MTKIKYLRHATFTEAEWLQFNPLLYKGEIAYTIDENLIITGYKVGPGNWNELEYQGGDEYPYPDVVTNEIGDAKGVLQGKPSAEILHLMLNPFQNVVVNVVQNDADGRAPATNQTFEIGSQLSGSINILYTVSNENNLAPILPALEPINISTNTGIFTNEGEFPFGNAIMQLNGILNPVTQETHIITVEATDSDGGSSSNVSNIIFSPRLQWGTSNGDTINSILSGDTVPKIILNGHKFSISSQHKRNYDITNVGYTWLIIPQMLGPNNLIFTDVTDPNAPANYAMQDMGGRLIDTSVGQYECQFYRSTFYLNSNGILRVS